MKRLEFFGAFLQEIISKCYAISDLLIFLKYNQRGVEFLIALTFSYNRFWKGIYFPKRILAKNDRLYGSGK